MEGSRDITAASSNNGGDDTTEETNPEIQSPPTRNRIACKTGHILNDLTASIWFSFSLVYFQNVVSLSPVSVGVLFFISQLLVAVGLLVVGFGYDARIWRSFSAYGKKKARHIVGSAGILFAWPLAFAPCLFCQDDSSNLAVTMYYLIPLVLFSICWPLAERSYTSLMFEIQAGADKDFGKSRSSIVRVCNVCLYILLWVLLQHSSEENLNRNTSREFALFVIILLPVGFLFVFAFHLTVLEPKPHAASPEAKKNGEEKYSGRSTTSISSPNNLANQEPRSKIHWYEWMREPLVYQIGLVCIFTNNAIKLLQVYLPIYLIETLHLRKEAVAFFPLIIVISRIVTEISSKGILARIKLRVVILCTTTAIFGTCMWYFLQTNSRGPLVYVPTVIFACMSSILIMITPNLQKKLTLNDKEVASVIHSVFECLERLSLGALVLLVQLFYPDTNERSIGEYIRVAFPATYGTCIVIPLLVATAFLNSKNSEEGPQLTITVPSPMEGSAQIEGRLPSTHCVDLLGSSPASTPPVDIEQNERRRNSDCAELQGSSVPSTAAPSDAELDESRTHSHRNRGSSLSSTAVPSDVEPGETRARSKRDRDIEQVKRALDELHRLPSTDL